MTGPIDPLEQAAAWCEAGKPVAIATVVATWGSSPRRPGSRLAVDADSAFVGSVSGGCIEGAVIERALAVMASGEPELCEFGVTDERAWEVGLACGGRIEILVERFALDTGVWAELVAARRAKRSVVGLSELPGGQRRLVSDAAEVSDPALAAAVADAMAADRAGVVEVGGDRWFVEPHAPPLRLVIVGAVHIAQPLAAMAALAGFAVVVVDPRSAFATAERFPGVELRRDWPDEALAALELDARTAVVTLTHDPKLDDPALIAALGSPAFYVGALGSKKTHAARLERLAAAGLGDAAARIRGPVGLAIGARTPAEIAVSITAEIVDVLRRGRPR